MVTLLKDSFEDYDWAFDYYTRKAKNMYEGLSILFVAPHGSILRTFIMNVYKETLDMEKGETILFLNIVKALNPYVDRYTSSGVSLRKTELNDRQKEKIGNLSLGTRKVVIKCLVNSEWKSSGTLIERSYEVYTFCPENKELSYSTKVNTSKR